MYSQFNGNLFEVGGIALKAVLSTTLLPVLNQDDYSNIDGSAFLKLADSGALVKINLPNFPLLVTIYKTKTEIFLDADMIEESVIITRFVLCLDENGVILYMRKEGKGCANPESLTQLVKEARMVGINLHKKVNLMLLQDLDPLAAFNRDPDQEDIKMDET